MKSGAGEDSRLSNKFPNCFNGNDIRQAAKRELVGGDEQIQALVNRVLRTTHDTVLRAFEQKIRRLEDEKRILSEKLARASLPKRSFDDIFGLAMALLASPR